MMSGQSSSPVVHDACEDLGQNYLKADIIQSLALLVTIDGFVRRNEFGEGGILAPSQGQGYMKLKTLTKVFGIGEQ